MMFYESKARSPGITEALKLMGEGMPTPEQYYAQMPSKARRKLERKDELRKAKTGLKGPGRPRSVPPLDGPAPHLEAVRALPPHLLAPPPKADMSLMGQVLKHTLNHTSNPEVLERITEHTASKYPNLYSGLGEEEQEDPSWSPWPGAPRCLQQRMRPGDLPHTAPILKPAAAVAPAPTLAIKRANEAQAKERDSKAQQATAAKPEGEKTTAQTLEYITRGAQFRRPSQMYAETLELQRAAAAQPAPSVWTDVQNNSKSNLARTSTESFTNEQINASQTNESQGVAAVPKREASPTFKPASPTLGFKEEDTLWQGMAAGAHKQRLNEWKDKKENSGSTEQCEPPWFKPASPDINYVDEKILWEKMHINSQDIGSFVL